MGEPLSQPRTPRTSPRPGSTSPAPRTPSPRASSSWRPKSFQAVYDITRDPAMLLNIGESPGSGPATAKKALAGYRAYLGGPAASPRPGGGRKPHQHHRGSAGEPASARPPQVPPRVACLKSRRRDQLLAAPRPLSRGERSTDGTPCGTAAAGRRETRPSPPCRKRRRRRRPRTRPSPTLGARLSPAGAAHEPPAHRRLGHGRGGDRLATSGAIVGLGARDRADELRCRTTVPVGNQPPVYDEGRGGLYDALKRRLTPTTRPPLFCSGTVSAVAGDRRRPVHRRLCPPPQGRVEDQGRLGARSVARSGCRGPQRGRARALLR